MPPWKISDEDIEAASDLSMSDEITRRYVAEMMKRREDYIRYLLGQWVSGLTPMLIVRATTGEILGLGAEEDESSHPQIVVKADLCECPRYVGAPELCSPTRGGFNCGGQYRMPVPPANCRRALGYSTFTF